MGLSYSRSIYRNNRYEDLDKDIKKFISDYSFWIDVDMCDRAEFFYYDKLTKFPKNDLIDMSIGIGIKVDDKIDRSSLCHAIAKNFRLRLDIIKKVYDTIVQNRNKLDQIHNGPVCRSVNAYIDDFLKCEQNKGEWLNEDLFTKYIDSMGDNQYAKYIENRDKLKEKYDKYMREMSATVRTLIDDSDMKLSIEELQTLYNSTIDKCNKMDKIIDIVYLIAINA